MTVEAEQIIFAATSRQALTLLQPQVCCHPDNLKLGVFTSSCACKVVCKACGHSLWFAERWSMPMRTTELGNLVWQAARLPSMNAARRWRYPVEIRRYE